MSAAFWFMVTVVAAVAMSLIAVLGWLSLRKREREAYYRSEAVRKVAESGDSAAALEIIRELQKAEASRMRNGARLAGLVTIAAGLGLMVFLAVVVVGAQRPIHLVGLIPVLVGVALLIFTELIMRPKS
jgi:ferric-dicitrate binding protein FerR (iron transport regulator)